MGIVIRRSLAVLPVLALGAISALAQVPDLSKIASVEYNPILLVNPAVIKELKVSPATATKIQRTFYQEASRVMPTILSAPDAKSALTPAQRTQRTFAAIGHMEASLAALLTPAQRLRWRQLTLQSIGASAALQPKVSSSLGLSSSQRERLANSISDANAGLANRLRSMSPNRMPELTRLQNEAKAKSSQALISILTPAQRTKWRAMLGRPMNLSGFLGAPAMGIGG